MIRKSIKELCKDFTKIENYEEAVNDKNELWTCHHRMEEVFSCKELMRAGWYYNRRPEELIFIKSSEHFGNPKLHYSVRERIRKQVGKPSGTLGRVMPEEEKKKRSKALKEYNATHDTPWKYRSQSKESNERRSNTTKITKQKMSLAYRQYKTNGGTLTWNAWGKNVWRGIEVREETK